jgi:hypothetical protein
MYAVKNFLSCIVVIHEHLDIMMHNIFEKRKNKKKEIGKLVTSVQKIGRKSAEK